MNRKGDLPSAMLLIMAITASIAVLIFFVTFDNNFNGQSKNLSLLVQNIELNEKYVIDKAAVIGEESILACVDCSDTPLNAKFKDAANKKDLSYTGAGNLFAKIRNGEFSFIKNGENYILEIKGKGMPVVNTSRHGDHYVTVDIVIPTKLSKEERTLYEELKKSQK
jgi:hypothetical protein